MRIQPKRRNNSKSSSFTCSSSGSGNSTPSGCSGEGPTKNLPQIAFVIAFILFHVWIFGGFDEFLEGSDNDATIKTQNDSTAISISVSEKSLASKTVEPSKVTSTIMKQQQQQQQQPQETFVVKPFTQYPQKSLHSKWKLWKEMTPEQQKQSIEDLSPIVKEYASGITKFYRFAVAEHLRCPLTSFNICDMKFDESQNKPCHFISMASDQSDALIAMADNWKCRGFIGAGPKSNIQSKVHSSITYHNIGIPTLRNDYSNPSHSDDMIVTSLPNLRQFLQIPQINVLRLDCEGCELAVARDILAQEPKFFDHVDQIILRTHVSKAFVDSEEELYYFGVFYALLKEAGFVTLNALARGCPNFHDQEAIGCMPEMSEKYGMICGLGPAKKIGFSCHQSVLVKKDIVYNN